MINHLSTFLLATVIEYVILHPSRRNQTLQCSISGENNSNQQQAQRIAEIKERMVQVSTNLVSALSTIQQMTQTVPSTPSSYQST